MTHRIVSMAVLLLLAFAPAVAAKDFENRIAAKPGGHLRVDLKGGSIEVEFPEDASVDLDAKTSGGRVEIEHEILVRGTSGRSHIVGQINGGGARLHLRTSGGDVRVRAR